MYMFFASIGAVVGSLLPWAMAHLGVSSLAPAGEISESVKYAFYVGATLLIAAVCGSAFTTREYPPEVLDKFDGAAQRDLAWTGRPTSMRRHAVGLDRDWDRSASRLRTWHTVARPRSTCWCSAALAYGVFLLTASRMRSENAFTTILGELESMSASMRWLALVQFFSWFTLFTIFMYTTPAVAKLHFGSQHSPDHPAYEAGRNWVGVLFAHLQRLGACRRTDHAVLRAGASACARAHQINLWIGAAGLLSMLAIRNPNWLLVSMIGLGFAWASIIALPYAMLANNLPSRKMGVNIGIFNIFIVIPQLLAVGRAGLAARRRSPSGSCRTPSSSARSAGSWRDWWCSGR